MESNEHNELGLIRRTFASSLTAYRILICIYYHNYICSLYTIITVDFGYGGHSDRPIMATLAGTESFPTIFSLNKPLI